VLISRQLRLGRARMLEFLDGLERSGNDGESLYIPPGLSPAETGRLLREVAGSEGTPPDLPELAAGSGTGAVLFWGLQRKCLVVPPFPIKELLLFHGYEAGLLRSLLQYDFTVAMVLVRLGSYAVGVCRGETLIESKVGTGLVHARHKKGGSSQHRFERHRDKQIEQFLIRVCGHVKERLEPHLRALDYAVYGGARTTILLLQKQCSFLSQLDGRILPPLLTIPEPRRPVLEAAVGQVWSSRLTEWRTIFSD